MDNVARLLVIVAHLRDPAQGCQWDLEQTFESIAPHTLEEAYELVEAIERGDTDDLKDELGDLLLQIVYHAQMAHEQDLFNFDRVAKAVGDKLVRRHPHVFGDAQYANKQAREAPGKRKRPASARPTSKRTARSAVSLPHYPRSRVRANCKSARRLWASTGRSARIFSQR